MSDASDAPDSSLLVQHPPPTFGEVRSIIQQRDWSALLMVDLTRVEGDPEPFEEYIRPHMKTCFEHACKEGLYMGPLGALTKRSSGIVGASWGGSYMHAMGEDSLKGLTYSRLMWAAVPSWLKGDSPKFLASLERGAVRVFDLSREPWGVIPFHDLAYALMEAQLVRLSETFGHPVIGRLDSKSARKQPPFFDKKDYNRTVYTVRYRASSRAHRDGDEGFISQGERIYLLLSGDMVVPAAEPWLASWDKMSNRAIAKALLLAALHLHGWPIRLDVDTLEDAVS